jgi:hypothetical protein
MELLDLSDFSAALLDNISILEFESFFGLISRGCP